LSGISFRQDIEGLRGIAVLLVVAFHCGVPHITGGFIGVDVFFVLSGYLITGMLVAEIRTTGKLNLAEFYARRIRRLLPASALMLAVTLLTSALILGPEELALAGRAGRAAALYMSNIFFSTNTANYFGPDVKSNPLLHTWSLAVEEQFYLFWPLLILLGLRGWRSTRAFVAIEAAITAISLGGCIWWTSLGGTFAFYELPARAWEFGIGGLVVLIPRGKLKLSPGSWIVLGWLALFTVLGSAALIVGDADFPGWIALIPVLGTAAALVAGAECPNRGPGVLLDSAPLERLGKLSYSWYLWHWPFLVLAQCLSPGISMNGKIAVALAALGMAAITHQLLENPIRFHPYLLGRPALSVGLAGVVTVVSMSAAFLSLRVAGRLADMPGMKKIAAAWDDDIAALPRGQCDTRWQSSAVKICVFGDPQSATNVVLFGDSHAIQWFNPLRSVVESHGWKLTTVVKSGCPAADIGPVQYGANFARTCVEWRSAAIGRIAQMHPSLVFAGSAAVHVGTRGRFGVSVVEWQKGTRRTLDSFSKAGLEVAAMRDNPIPSFDVPLCVARFLRRSGIAGGCEMERSAVLDPAIFEAERAAAYNLPRIHFIDLTDQFCHDKVCWAVEGGDVMYHDDNHLSGRATARLAPVLESQLVPMVNAASGNKVWAYAKPYSSR
jgi:peptidoglycan/LPS O-acetylase OafA/YrhL